jgi:site-specific DNA-methyltransferase (adenine-specific)
MEAFYGSENDSVATPVEFYKELNEEFTFDHDPCPIGGSGGLESSWGKSNYVNPPYSEISKWITKALVELQKGNKSVFLITARTNSAYWRDRIVPNATEIRLLNTGLIFQGYTKPFRIPLAIVVFDPNSKPSCKHVVKKTYSYYYTGIPK